MTRKSKINIKLDNYGGATFVSLFSGKKHLKSFLGLRLIKYLAETGQLKDILKGYLNYNLEADFEDTHKLLGELEK